MGSHRWRMYNVGEPIGGWKSGVQYGGFAFSQHKRTRKAFLDKQEVWPLSRWLGHKAEIIG